MVVDIASKMERRGRDANRRHSRRRERLARRPGWRLWWSWCAATAG